MRRQALVAAVGYVLLTASAFAQNAAPNPNAGPRVAGTIVSLEGKTLSVKTMDGQTMAVEIPDDLRIVARTPSTMANLKAGDFAGSAAVEGPDGRLHAEEVHIMEGALAGFGEGHRPMAPNPANAAAARTMTNATMAAVEPRTMTNATVAAVGEGAQGRVLTMKYKDGEKQIDVAPGTPITRMVISDKSVLKAGNVANLNTNKTPSGGLVGTQLIVDVK